MSYSSIWPQDSGSVSDGNEGVICFPQSSRIIGVSSSDCLMSYQGHSLGKSYSSAEMLSVYSIAPSNWARYWIVDVCMYVCMCVCLPIRTVRSPFRRNLARLKSEFSYSSDWLPYQRYRVKSNLLFALNRNDNSCIQNFTKDINVVWYVKTIVQDLNLAHRVHFQRR